MNAILGHTEPDPVGELLGTGYHRFNSPFGISGLCKEGQLRLDLLAVVASKPGTGQFRRFIEALKFNYLSLYVWEIMNRDLESALRRYGFIDTKQTEPWGEVITGMKWPM